MEFWPAGVPHAPLDSNVQLEPFRAPLGTDFEDGPQRYRRSTTKNIARMSFVLRLDYSAVATFKAFVRDTLVDGTLRFTMPVWTGGAYAQRVCQFTQPPKFTSMQTDFADIACSIDVEDY